MVSLGDIIEALIHAPLTAVVCVGILILVWRVPAMVEHVSDNAPPWMFNVVGLFLWGVALLWYWSAFDAWSAFLGTKGKINNANQFWDAALKINVLIFVPLIFVGRMVWNSTQQKAYDEGYQAATQKARWEREQERERAEEEVD